jgi:hypothetical protein
MVTAPVRAFQLETPAAAVATAFQLPAWRPYVFASDGASGIVIREPLPHLAPSKVHVAPFGAVKVWPFVGLLGKSNKSLTPLYAMTMARACAAADDVTLVRTAAETSFEMFSEMP